MLAKLKVHMSAGRTATSWVELRVASMAIQKVALMGGSVFWMAETKVVVKVVKLVGWMDRTMVESWAAWMVYSLVEWRACLLVGRLAASKDPNLAELRAAWKVVLTVVLLEGRQQIPQE